jgi:hypothetical protein
MKKLMLIAMLLMTIGFSCSKNEPENKSTLPEVISSDVPDNLRADVYAWRDNESDMKAAAYDFNNMSMVQAANSVVKVIVVPAVGNPAEAIGFFVNNNALTPYPIILSASETTTSKKIILSTTDGYIADIYVLDKKTLTVSHGLLKTATPRGYANCIAECVFDVYSQHGWISAWAVYQTRYIPSTGLAFLGACAIACH